MSANGSPNVVERKAGQARRRLRWFLLERWSGRWLLWALLTAVGLLLVDKVWRWPFQPETVGGVTCLAGLLVGLLVGASKQVSLFQAAQMLDERLGLQERLSSALELALGQPPSPRSEMIDPLLEDAERHATTADVRRAFPHRWPREWPCCCGLLALALVLVFLPGFHFLQPPGERAVQQEAKRVGDEIVRLAREMEREADEKELEQTRQAARKLFQLGRKLQRARWDKKETLQKLAQLSADLKAQHQQQAGKFQKANEVALAELRQAPGKLGEMGEQLQEMKLEAARAALQELQEKLKQGGLSSQQMQQLAQQMQQAAQALQGSAFEDVASQLQKAAESLSQAAQQASQSDPAGQQAAQQTLQQAAAALEQAGQSLEGAVSEMTEQELLEAGQQMAEAAKQQMGNADTECSQCGQLQGHHKPGGG